MKILLPDNTFGAIIMLILVVLAFVVPFVISLWLISLVAPLWVSIPVALLIGIIVFVKMVKFKN